MALIDQRDGVFTLAAAAPIDHLAAIGIANPFIEGERAGEDFEVAHVSGIEHGFGHVVEHLAVHGMDHKARAELQSGLARNLDAAELASFAEAIPPEWYEGDWDALAALIEKLAARRSRVRELVSDFRLSSRAPFVNWRNAEKKQVVM